jgi:hypothetical protein
MKFQDENLKSYSFTDNNKKNKNIKAKEVNMDIKKLNHAIEYLKDQMGKGLINTDIWTTADGQSVASYQSQPKAVALFNRLTQYMVDALHQSEESFVELGRYYLIDLIGNHMVICVYMGEYQWGLMFDKKEVQLGLVLNFVIPKIIDIFEEAVTG